MLKARVIGGRQTRSRTAKATPKRASAPAKTTEEEETPADASVPKRATAPAVISEEKKTQAGVCFTRSYILLECGLCMHAWNAEGWFLPCLQMYWCV